MKGLATIALCLVCTWGVVKVAKLATTAHVTPPTAIQVFDEARAYGATITEIARAHDIRGMELAPFDEWQIWLDDHEPGKYHVSGYAIKREPLELFDIQAVVWLGEWSAYVDTLSICCDERF